MRSTRIRVCKMKTKIKSLLVLLIASISFISCDSDVEYVEQNTDVVIGAEGTITIGSGGIDYKMKNCKLKKGESLKIDFSKTGSCDVNAVVVLYLDDEELCVLKEFPTTFSYRMEQTGIHKLTIKQATLHNDGTISVSTSVATNVAITVV